MMDRPHFIVIGAMKCATSTIHEQLAQQPGIFMSTPKEPNFFSDDEIWARGPDWYRGLFRAAPANAICGESSTHYTKLPRHACAVPRMLQHLRSDVRFIYIMRDPIDRLISQYIHEWTQRHISGSLNDAIDHHPELIDYSRYAMQLTPYLDAFGPERILPMFFERVTRCPQQELERICEFIGYEGAPTWNNLASEQNVSSQRLRKCGWRDAVVNCPGLKTIRRRFVPQVTRDWVKRFWTMKERPTLSEENRHRLCDIFDADLAQLGSWLGLSLRCETFKDIAASTVPSWRISQRINAA